MYRPFLIAMLVAAVWAPWAPYAAAVEPDTLVEGLTSSFEHVRREAVDLAPQAGPSAVAPVAALLSSSTPVVVKAAALALDRIVAHAGRPGASEERSAVCSALNALLDSKHPEATRRTALRLLGLVASDADTDAIGALLDDPNLAEDARATLDSISTPGAVKALAQKLGSAPKELRPSLLATMARILERLLSAGSGDANGSSIKMPASALDEAIQAIKPYAGDAGPETRWCAFDALCRLGVPPNTLPVSPQVFARENRQRYMTGFLNSAYANLALGNRDAAENMFATLAAFPMGRSQACAALIGLAKLNSPKLIENAMGYLSEPGIRVTAMEALTAADIPEINARLANGLTYANPSNRVAILRVLAARQAPDIRALLTSMKQDAAPDVRVAAFELLGEPPADTDLGDALVKSTPWNREHAGQLYLARGKDALEAGDAEKSRVILEAVAAARISPETRAEAFRCLAQLANPASQPLVDRVYEELAAPGALPASRELAVAVAQTYAAVHAALSDKAAAERDLRRLIESNDDPGVRNAALQKLRDLGADSRVYARRQGFVTDWHVLGPFPNSENSAFGKPIIDITRPISSDPIEIDGAAYRWQPVVSDAIPAVVDLKSIFHGGENVAAYACALLSSATEAPVTLLLGSNDGCEVWVNQTKVFEHAEARGLTVDQDRIDTVLKPGLNTILVKVLQRGGSWGVCLRVVDAQGAPLDTTSLQPTS